MYIDIVSILIIILIKSVKDMSHDLRSEVLQETISSEPVVAHGLRPAEPVQALPLRSEVPAQGDGTTP